MTSMEKIRIQDIQAGDLRALTRAISYVENERGPYRQLLESLPFSDKKIIGITGPPGAGKSTLVNSILRQWVGEKKTVGVLCVDPSSPFRGGALLGDRIRMNEWVNHPSVFIRSLATRGSLGGLNPRIIGITDLMKAAAFDHIIIETVGVGQNEIEIAGLADVTVVVLVPEAGDDIQTMKAGLMEIADIFVVNKADRPDADRFVRDLQQLSIPLSHQRGKDLPVIRTIASENEGVSALLEKIQEQLQTRDKIEEKTWLMAEKAYQLISHQRMQNIDKDELIRAIRRQLEEGKFNLYSFVSDFSDFHQR
jgi:LAO/AO transport system kinase